MIFKRNFGPSFPFALASQHVPYYVIIIGQSGEIKIVQNAKQNLSIYQRAELLDEAISVIDRFYTLHIIIDDRFSIIIHNLREDDTSRVFTKFYSKPIIDEVPSITRLTKILPLFPKHEQWKLIKKSLWQSIFKYYLDIPDKIGLAISLIGYVSVFLLDKPYSTIVAYPTVITMFINLLRIK